MIIKELFIHSQVSIALNSKNDPKNVFITVLQR